MGLDWSGLEIEFNARELGILEGANIPNTTNTILTSFDAEMGRLASQLPNEPNAVLSAAQQNLLMLLTSLL